MFLYKKEENYTSIMVTIPLNGAAPDCSKHTADDGREEFGLTVGTGSQQLFHLFHITLQAIMDAPG